MRFSHVAIASAAVLTTAAASVYVLGWRHGINTSINGGSAVPSDFVEMQSTTGSLWVAREETTVSQWLACVDDGVCPEIAIDELKRDHPVTGVNWNDASAYLSWYSSTFGMPVRLPTRDEWLQFAADDAPKTKTKLFDDPRLAWAADYDLTAVPQSSVTEPSGSFGSNSYGINDLTGNVWEWTASCQLEIAGLPSETHGCITGRYAMGNHVVVLSDRLRTPGNAGCSGNQPPANIGLRLVRQL